MTTMIISTPSMEDYVDVVRWAIDQNMIWRNESTLIHRHYWREYRSDTCIIITNNELMYADADYCKRNYDPYEVDMFDMKQFYKYTREYHYEKFREKYNLK